MLTTFTIHSTCVADDATLYAHIQANLLRDVPVLPQHDAHDGVAVMVGSGPSVAWQVQAIRDAKAQGHFLVAIKDAHDWLLAQGVVPHCAVAIDPQASRAHVFTTPHPSVHYFLASQVHPSMLDHLAGYPVSLWHAYVRKDQAVPPHGTPLIAGGTTTGLRAITLLYSMGFRTFELYGYDSCLSDGKLRMNGDVPRAGDDTINEIVVGSERFLCNPSMTAQATEFQQLFWSMPDVTIHAHGIGLIQAIVSLREARPLRTTSFLHHLGPQAASYRYRAQIPADLLGGTLNDLTADVVVVSKPEAVTIPEVKACLGRGQSVIADFCDDHFDTRHYRDLLRLADAVTCCSEVLARTIASYGREATVIVDPYESPERTPHCAGARLLWFGHALNLPDANLTRFAHHALHVVSNAPGTIPWSRATMEEEWARADIVILPASASYKSANRAVESIRQGCFVVAEPHPALATIPGLWLGDLEEGIQWAIQHPDEANQRTRRSQTSLSHIYAPSIVASAWSRVIQACPSTWGQDVAAGPIGSMLTMPTPTYAAI